MNAYTDATVSVEAVRRYLLHLKPLLEAVETLPVEQVGGTLAVVAGVAQLLGDRALTAYGKVREARGLAPLVGPFPDPSLLVKLGEAIEALGGGDPGDLG